MALFIEYYEVAAADGYEYYYMPVDTDAKNKENMDRRSHRIWRFNTRSNHITEVTNGIPEETQLDSAEFFKIQLTAKPVPWDENYLFLQEVKRHREQTNED